MMKVKRKLGNCFFLCVFLFLGSGCNSGSEDGLLTHIEKQLSLLLDEAEQMNRNPRTIKENGETSWIGNGFDWTEGFFPGTCWLLYELTDDPKWKIAADKFQTLNRNHTTASNHDLGFVFHCSYGNGYRLTKNEAYPEVMKEAGETLIGRFNPITGTIKSWDNDKGWQATRGWSYPVIIDNMMNLELLFELTRLTGDSVYHKVAVTHANSTLKNHFREDGSSYHVVNYCQDTGEVLSRETAQGYAHESSWARGQAWGLYGYTLCYRYTKDENYLRMAEKIAHYIMTHPAIPADKVPYWDYHDPTIPNAYRDVSAASITASALFELRHYANYSKYHEYASQIMESLATEEYLAEIGTNNKFLLKHSVGSIPHKAEIDVSLNYADYYYVEAFIRQQQR